jgi:hypothetical protein
MPTFRNACAAIVFLTSLVLPLHPMAGVHQGADVRPSLVPRQHRALMVIVGDSRGTDTPELTVETYDAVFRRAAIVLERESLNRLQLTYTTVKLPVSAIGQATLQYRGRTYKDWYQLLRAETTEHVYDVLVFGPDKRTPWCTDAHSMGFQMDSTIFLCLEAPASVTAASNVLIHKMFHTFGFFHQENRNKQYRLLNWELGLPAYTDLEAMDDIAFFAPPVLTSLGIRADDGTYGACQRSGLLSCRKPAWVPEECQDVAGPSCRDADRDGVLDLDDGLPVSPPQMPGEPDEDRDGTPDRLDLCPASGLSVRGNVTGGPMNYRSTEPTVSMAVGAPGDRVSDVTWVSPLWGPELFFDDSAAHVAAPNRIEVPKQRESPVRVQVRHDYRGTPVRTTFYLYMPPVNRTSPNPWGYFNERDWFYFGRFGCPTPATVDFRDVKTYDADANGVTDRTVFRTLGIDEGRLARYDWDRDGVPDAVDTLPTVAGTCSNTSVRGVKDSDGDGLCDPGALSYVQPSNSKDRTFDGQFSISIKHDSSFDKCPYLPGPAALSGCPKRPDGQSWYADAYPFSAGKTGK